MSADVKLTDHPLFRRFLLLDAAFLGFVVITTIVLLVASGASIALWWGAWGLVFTGFSLWDTYRRCRSWRDRTGLWEGM